MDTESLLSEREISQIEPNHTKIKTTDDTEYNGDVNVNLNLEPARQCDLNQRSVLNQETIGGIVG